MPALPAALTRNLADSEIAVISWSAESGEMVLRVTKVVGPEIGLLRLTGVGMAHLPPQFEVVAIGSYDRPFPDYPDLRLEDGEFAVAFQDVRGHAYCVTVKSVVYDKITPQPRGH